MASVGSSSVTRIASLRAVFTAMLRNGPVSRAELARLTGLSKQTTSEIVRVLEDAGWIRLSGCTQGAVGRRATTYELDQNCAFVLGVDLGGTKIHVALANLLGTIVTETTEPTDTRGGRHVVRQVRDSALELARQIGIAPTLIRAGTMGSPGVVQPGTGRVHLAPNIPDFDRFDVVGALSEALGFTIGIENDVNLATLGERQHATRRDVLDMAFIALGTGIGMGIIANGQLVQGSRGGAGEIAYLPLGGDPFDSRGFVLGTLETSVGAGSIVERYRRSGGNSALDVRGIFDRLEAGDAAAEGTIDEVARLLAQTIMVVRAVLDPQIVVLGGSIGARPELVDRVHRLASRFVGEHPSIEVSLFGNRAALIGAVELALRSLHRSLFEPVGPHAGRSPSMHAPALPSPTPGGSP
jgi:predicted NBD/HSP70 family sugar kinase